MFRLFFLLVLPALTLVSRPVAAQPGSAALLTPGPDTSTSPAAVTPVVYTIAEEMPAFPGGAAAFQRFLHDKIRYPAEALRKGVAGKVYVSFIIDEEGRIRDAAILRGLGAGLDEEALRLVRIMPWWTPGRVQGQPVRVAYTLPITFALE